MKNSKSVLQMEDFVAYAAHELRSPLTIIRGFAEVLHDHTDLPPERVRDISGTILHTSIRLEKIVKGLLTLSDPGFVTESVQLRALVEHCRNLAHLLHPDAQITVQGEETQIIGDIDLLELAVGNLLENAIKYSPRPAKINVHVFREGSKIRMAVQDEGIGIPKEHLTHIFDRFYTVDKSHSRKLGGAGLGLSLVNAIVKKHAGSISVTSEPGRGTIFTLELPSIDERKFL